MLRRSAWLLVGALALVVVAILAMIGAPGEPDPSRTRGDEREAPGTAAPRNGAGVSADHTIVRLAAEKSPETFPSGYRVIDRLDPDTVLRVRVDGFAPHAEARVMQCVHTDVVECGNQFPVQFDADGVAFFQYEARQDFHPTSRQAGACRAATARCTLVVQASADGTRAEIDTVFVDARPAPGVIRVDPSSGLTDGEPVTVRVSGYPPGAGVVATLCAAPDVTGSQRCGAPGPSAPLVVGRDGTGTASLRVREGPVGTERVRCGGSVPCAVSVGSPEVFVGAPVVPVAFAGPAGAAYDTTRVVIGLAVALVLIGLAAWFIRRTDWSPVGEAAAPEIDYAAYADLDAIIAALPPEPDDETSVTAPR